MTNSSISATLIFIALFLFWAAAYLADEGEIFLGILIAAIAIFLIYVNGFFDGK